MNPTFDTDAIVALMTALDAEYSLRPRHPEREAIYADYAARSEALRAASPHWKCLKYAAPERCAIDWFPAAGPAPAGGAPLLVFIHGGFWRALDRRQFSFVAEHYVRAGIAVALIGYELAPRVSVATIVEEARQALHWLNGHARDLGFDRSRIVVSGHSAGGHLAAMLAAAEPATLGGLPLAACVPISGVFALEPLLLTSINLDVRMSPQDAVRLSPARAGRFHAKRFLVVAGGRETEGFIGQSRDFQHALAAAGVDAALDIVPGRTHFDILEDFARPDRPLFGKVTALTVTRAD